MRKILLSNYIDPESYEARHVAVIKFPDGSKLNLEIGDEGYIDHKLPKEETDVLKYELIRSKLEILKLPPMTQEEISFFLNPFGNTFLDQMNISGKDFQQLAGFNVEENTTYIENGLKIEKTITYEKNNHIPLRTEVEDRIIEQMKRYGSSIVPNDTPIHVEANDDTIEVTIRSDNPIIIDRNS